MHELALAQSLFDIVMDYAARHKAGKVLCVKILVGQMTHVDHDSLKFGFKAVAAQSVAAEAELCIETVPLSGRCGDCGKEFRIQDYRFMCPHCGFSKVDILSGRELKVEYLEVE